MHQTSDGTLKMLLESDENCTSTSRNNLMHLQNSSMAPVHVFLLITFILYYSVQMLFYIVQQYI